MDASEALLLSERNRGYDDGYGMSGGVFMWVIVLVLIFFAFGWGRNNNGWGNGDGVNNNGLVAALAAQGRTQDLSQVERDVLQTSCKTQSDVFNTACATQKEILESRYTTQLGFQAQQAQLSQCCCDIKEAIHSDGEQTRALIQCDTIQGLRDANDELQRQLLLNQLVSQNQNQTASLINSLLPRAVPAYLSCSPYMANYFGMFGFGNGCNCGGCGNGGCGCGC